VCRADFYIHAQVPGQPGIHEFWLVTAPGILARPASYSRRIGYLLQEVFESWGANCLGTHPLRIIRAHAEEKGCALTECSKSTIVQDLPDARRIDRRIRIEDPNGDHITIDFEESGAVCRINYPPGPSLPASTAQRSWMDKLLGRRKPR
jgi:hypothetical protein